MLTLCSFDILFIDMYVVAGPSNACEVLLSVSGVCLFVCLPVGLFVCLFVCFFSCEVCTGNKKSVCLFVFQL